MAKGFSLGKGLNELFADNSTDTGERVTHLPIADIDADENQHRKQFDEQALQELSDSIKLHGVLQPILVKPTDKDRYMIIAGERRYRASKMAGLTEIPAIVKSLSDSDAAEISLIENLQRKDLNPIEEASGYMSLIETFGLTQEQAAARVGKSRSSVANSLRLLSLPASAQGLLRDGVITTGHAKVLLGVKEPDLQNELLCAIVSHDWSVRELENELKRLTADRKPKKTAKKGVSEVTLEHFRSLESRASATLGRKVKFSPQAEGNGSITLEYFDSDDFEELLNLLCGEDFFTN